MFKSILTALSVTALGVLSFAGKAEAKVFTGDRYSITFGTGWDTVQTRSILGKNMGLSGMATLGATLGSTLPNVDSLTTVYSDTLGGAIKKDSIGKMTLGRYEVRWQKYTYDSLPGLSALVARAVGVPVSLKNGSFRVYYLNADGVSFSIACMSIISGVKAPYADVEAALATLKLTAGTGIIPLSRGPVHGLWVKDGKLGGGWLKANRVFAVECYDMRGAFLGPATHAAEGAWLLPRFGSEMLVRLKTVNGQGIHFLVRP